MTSQHGNSSTEVVLRVHGSKDCSAKGVPTTADRISPKGETNNPQTQLGRNWPYPAWQARLVNRFLGFSPELGRLFFRATLMGDRTDHGESFA
jgi:hypothetical protein